MVNKKKSAKKVAAKIPAGIKVLQLETGVPVPERGARDPEFLRDVESILKAMKVKQSFVLPKNKVHTTQKIVKALFPQYKIRTSIITPDKKFSRIWRLA